MYIVEFIDKHNETVFRRKTFTSPREMHEFICQFELREGKVYSFYDHNLEKFKANFCRLTPFSDQEVVGFKLFFEMELAKV